MGAKRERRGTHAPSGNRVACTDVRPRIVETSRAERPYGSCEINKMSLILSQKMPYGGYEKFQEIHSPFSDLMVTLKAQKEDFYSPFRVPCKV